MFMRKGGKSGRVSHTLNIDNTKILFILTAVQLQVEAITKLQCTRKSVKRFIR